MQHMYTHYQQRSLVILGLQKFEVAPQLTR